MDVLEIELTACSPQVALLVEVSLEVSISTSRQRISPDIEFPSIIQERVVNVLLNNACSL